MFLFFGRKLFCQFRTCIQDKRLVAFGGAQLRRQATCCPGTDDNNIVVVFFQGDGPTTESCILPDLRLKSIPYPAAAAAGSMHNYADLEYR
jgi:hypothetical protein